MARKKLTKGERAIALLENFVYSGWGEAFKNDEDVNGADFVEYAGSFYKQAKKILESEE